jgi:RNA polymerase sigma factor for flagellar operon FliA
MSRLAPPLPAFALRELWRRVRKGDAEARERLVLAYAPLVKYVAGRMSSALPRHVDLEEVTSWGLVGLLKAVDGFDPRRGVPFEAYAIQRVRGEIIDEIRAQDWAPRSVRQRQRALEAAIRKVEQREGRPATDPELASELGVPEQELESLLGDVARASLFSLNEMVAAPGGEETAELAAVVADPSADTQAKGEQNALREAIAEAIVALPQRERVVVSLYFYDGLTLREIGQVLGVTESRCSQLLSKAVIRMRGRIMRELATS